MSLPCIPNNLVPRVSLLCHSWSLEERLREAEKRDPVNLYFNAIQCWQYLAVHLTNVECKNNNSCQVIDGLDMNIFLTVYIVFLNVNYPMLTIYCSLKERKT